jgi:hypothetical protein
VNQEEAYTKYKPLTSTTELNPLGYIKQVRCFVRMTYHSFIVLLKKESNTKEDDRASGNIVLLNAPYILFFI